MNFNLKTKLQLAAAIIGAQILPLIANATCSTDIGECITMPTWAEFSAANGDWVAGMFGFVSTPMFFGIALLLFVGIIGFIVSLVSRAVSHMHQ